MKYKLAFVLTFASATVCAEQYNSITTGGYEHQEIESPYRYIKNNDEFDTFSINSTYYASPKSNLGPLKEFEYINKINNFFGEFSSTEETEGRYNREEKEDSLRVGGEYFYEKFKFGGSIRSNEDLGFYRASAGYFFNPDLLIELEGTSFKEEDEDDQVVLRGQYKRPLDKGNYIGFSASIDKEMESRTFASKLYTELNNDRYLTLGLSILDNDEDGQLWRGEMEFYFNKASSVKVEYEETDNYILEATHFFNRHLAAILSYGSNLGSDEDYRGSYRDTEARDLFSLGLRLQL